MDNNNLKGHPEAFEGIVLGPDGNRRRVKRRVIQTQQRRYVVQGKSFKSAFIGMTVLSFLLLGGMAYPIYLAATNGVTSGELSKYNLKTESILKKDLASNKVYAFVGEEKVATDITPNIAYVPTTPTSTTPPVGIPNVVQRGFSAAEVNAAGYLSTPGGSGLPGTSVSSVTVNYNPKTTSVDVSNTNVGTYTLAKPTGGAPTLTPLTVVDSSLYILKSAISTSALYKPTGTGTGKTLGSDVTNNYVDVSAATFTDTGTYTLSKPTTGAPTLTTFTPTAAVPTNTYILKNTLANNGLYKASGTGTDLELSADVTNNYVDVSAATFTNSGTYTLTKPTTGAPTLTTFTPTAAVPTNTYILKNTLANNGIYKASGTGTDLELSADVTNNYVDVSAAIFTNSGTYTLTKPTTGAPTLAPLTVVNSNLYILKSAISTSALYKPSGTGTSKTLGNDVTNKYIEKSTITANALYKPAGIGDAVALGNDVTNNYVDVSAATFTNSGTYTLTKPTTGAPTLVAYNPLTLHNLKTTSVDVSNDVNGVYDLSKPTATGAIPTLTLATSKYADASGLPTDGVYKLVRDGNNAPKFELTLENKLIRFDTNERTNTNLIQTSATTMNFKDVVNKFLPAYAHLTDENISTILANPTEYEIKIWIGDRRVASSDLNDQYNAPTRVWEVTNWNGEDKTSLFRLTDAPVAVPTNLNRYFFDIIFTRTIDPTTNLTSASWRLVDQHTFNPSAFGALRALTITKITPTP